MALAPWWGGFFERLVKSTKRCLKKSLGTARVTYEELLTIIVETEGILNSRPLTYVSDARSSYTVATCYWSSLVEFTRKR